MRRGEEKIFRFVRWVWTCVCEKLEGGIGKGLWLEIALGSRY